MADTTAMERHGSRRRLNQPLQQIRRAMSRQPPFLRRPLPRHATSDRAVARTRSRPAGARTTGAA